MKSGCFLFIPVFLVLFGKLPAQTAGASAFREDPVAVESGRLTLHGTITFPEKTKGRVPVVLLIAGSGPTDRNGNNPFGLNTDAYKLLAHALAKNGIASLRYDKRNTGESRFRDTAAGSVKRGTFEDEVSDARAMAAFLKKDRRFSRLVIAGHSQGSLIGMLAAEQADRFISIAGLGFNGAETIKRQLKPQPEYVREKSAVIIDSLQNGHLVKDVPDYLAPLFGAVNQPLLLSWFRYDPAAELSRLKIPSLIIQGTKDIQIDTADAIRLAAGSKKAALVLINDMNHVFRIISGGQEENLKSYGDPSLPVAPQLVDEIVAFTRKKR